jgi:hypothetical protein
MTLRGLDLRAAEFGIWPVMGAAAQCLGRLSALHELHLRRHRVNNACISALGAALAHARELTLLNLSESSVDDDVAAASLRALARPLMRRTPDLQADLRV